MPYQHTLTLPIFSGTRKKGLLLQRQPQDQRDRVASHRRSFPMLRCSDDVFISDTGEVFHCRLEAMTRWLRSIKNWGAEDIRTMVPILARISFDRSAAGSATDTCLPLSRFSGSIVVVISILQFDPVLGNLKISASNRVCL